MSDEEVFNQTVYEFQPSIMNTSLAEYYENPMNIPDDLIRNFLSENVTDEYLLNLIKQHQKIFPVYCYMVLCVTGVVGTSTSLLVFTRKSMCSSSLNAILVILELANLVFLLVYLQSTILRLYFVDYMLTPWYSLWMKLLACLCMPFMTFFNLMTVLINIWRIISVKQPLKAKRLLRPKQAIIFTLIIFISSFFLNIYKFMGLNGTVDRTLVLKFFSIRSVYNPNIPGYTEMYPNVQRFLTMVCYVVGYLIPLFCCVVSVIFLGYNLYSIKKKHKELMEGQTSKELRMTYMMLFLFLGFLLSYANPVLLLVQQYLHPGTFFATPLCLGMCLPVLIITNLNFFVYLAVSGNFRKTFRDTSLSAKQSLMKIMSQRQ